MGSGARLTAIISLVTAALGNSALGQESIQPSMAGDATAEMRKVINRSDYNLRLGPVLVDLSASTEVEFNDNINLSDHARTSDFIFVPQFNVNMDWPVSRVNELRLDLGIGYAAYVNHPELDSTALLITPQSLLSFDVYVGDFRFNFHDYFSLQQNPVDTIDLTNVARFQRFENSVGVWALWDLNQVRLLGGYDHYLFQSLDSLFDYLNQSQEQFFLSTDVILNRTTTTGVRATAALVNYNSNSVFNDSTEFSVGPFLEMDLTPYTRIRVAAGYQGFYPRGNVPGQTSSAQNGGFANLDIIQRLNRYFTQYLNVGYDTELGTTTAYQKVLFVRYTGEWRVNSRANIAFGGFYEHAQETASIYGEENASQYGISIFLSSRIAQRATAGIGYLFTARSSNLVDRSYTQDQVIFRIGYDF